MSKSRPRSPSSRSKWIMVRRVVADGAVCHIKHILAADVKHIVAPQQQYARGARCALETQIGVGLGCYAEPKQGGLVRPVATLCFMRWPLYTLCDTVHGVICDDVVEVGASGVVQRVFRADSKPMCPSAPIHKTTLPAPMGMRRHKATQRTMREDRSPFIGGTRTCAGKSDSLQGRNKG